MVERVFFFMLPILLFSMKTKCYNYMANAILCQLSARIMRRLKMTARSFSHLLMMVATTGHCGSGHCNAKEPTLWHTNAQFKLIICHRYAMFTDNRNAMDIDENAGCFNCDRSIRCFQIDILIGRP